MRVKHCPSCGSDDISKSSSSFEYGGSTRWSCGSCGWGYKKGRGIGTGTGNSGTHPRKAGPSSGQSTLTQVAEWCSTCDTAAKPGHCRCVEDDQTGFCEDCANYSAVDKSEMLEVATYFGRHSTFEGFTCSVCGEKDAELKIA